MFVFEANQRKLSCISIQFSNNKVGCFSITKIFGYIPTFELRRKRTPSNLCVVHCYPHLMAGWSGGLKGRDGWDKVCKMNWKIFRSCFVECRVKEVLRYPHLIKKPTTKKVVGFT